jgi:hypothetical protein
MKLNGEEIVVRAMAVGLAVGTVLMLIGGFTEIVPLIVVGGVVMGTPVLIAILHIAFTYRS